MRCKNLALLGAIFLAPFAATPAFALQGWFNQAPPGFAHQNPDGSYPSYGDYSQSLWGTPCGINCMHTAAERWGLIPPDVPTYHYRYHAHRYGYYPY